MRILLNTFLLLLPFTLLAQLNIPPSSAPAELRTQIGLTNFTITYHRPSVKGRVIFSELLPYGQVWRTGANEATRIQFDQDIRIGGDPLAAGTYAIYTIPQKEDNWTIILNADTTLWGARGYDESKDVARFMLPAKALPERVETMEFRWMDITHTSAKLCLEWENIRLSIPIEVLTNEQVNASIAEELTPANTKGNDYYRAARYYLDNGLDLKQAKVWMDKRIELGGEQFGIMRYQAFIERKLGNLDAANRIMERSLELAEAAPNPHYVRMNTQTLQQWNKEVVSSLSGGELIDKSIAYHAPKGEWEKGGITLSLHESRPGGNYRITDLEINIAEEKFILYQRRGPDLIFRSLLSGGCLFALNGRTHDFTEEEIRQFRLSCESNELYRDYYTYLWALPMKLKDTGTIIDPQVHRVDFFGDELLEVKVTYSEEVGADIWYFYFDPETYALSGYRFYHDEAANDGEYILLEDEVEVGHLRIPAKRHWYTHKDRRYLGTDEILRY